MKPSYNVYFSGGPLVGRRSIVPRSQITETMLFLVPTAAVTTEQYAYRIDPECIGAKHKGEYVGRRTLGQAFCD